MDKIIIDEMICYGYHGALPEENVLGQKFIITLELFLDLKAVGEKDDLNLGVSYADVFLLVREIAEKKEFKLLEALAQTISSTLLEKFPLSKVRVLVKKPEAPIPGIFNYVGVDITRSKETFKDGCI